MGEIGIAERQFIINCNFWLFLFFCGGTKFRFINKYRELETVEPGDRDKSLGETA